MAKQVLFYYAARMRVQCSMLIIIYQIIMHVALKFVVKYNRAIASKTMGSKYSEISLRKLSSKYFQPIQVC